MEDRGDVASGDRRFSEMLRSEREDEKGLWELSAGRQPALTKATYLSESYCGELKEQLILLVPEEVSRPAVGVRRGWGHD